jgi:hypothetical protein
MAFPINDLPTEVSKIISINSVIFIEAIKFQLLYCIFENADLETRKSASLVCKKWGYISFSKGLMKNVVLTLDYHVTNYKIFEKIMKTTSRTYLNVYYGYFNSTPNGKNHTEKVLLLVSRFFGPGIQFLKVANCFNYDLTMLSLTPNVTSLELSRIETSNALENREIPILPNLTKLSLISHMLSINKNVKEFFLIIRQLAPNVSDLTLEVYKTEQDLVDGQLEYLRYCSDLLEKLKLTIRTHCHDFPRDFREKGLQIGSGQFFQKVSQQKLLFWPFGIRQGPI